MEKKKWKNKSYTDEAEQYFRENYGLKDVRTFKGELQSITGKQHSYNAIRIKAYRLDLVPMTEASTELKMHELAAILKTTKVYSFGKKAGFSHKVKGLNCAIVDIPKFWKWAKETNYINWLEYERGSILPEPKIDKKTGKSWLDERIEQQRKEKQEKVVFDKIMIARIKVLCQQGLTPKEISDKLKLDYAHVYYYARKYKLINVTPAKELTGEEERAIYNEWLDGATKTELRKKYNRSFPTVTKIINNQLNKRN